MIDPFYAAFFLLFIAIILMQDAAIRAYKRKVTRQASLLHFSLELIKTLSVTSSAISPIAQSIMNDIIKEMKRGIE